MTAHIGGYVEASFEFLGEGVSDLHLSVGDIVRVIEVLDENWAVGQKIGPHNLTGIFPLAFVECLTLPSVSDDQKIFLAIDNFSKNQSDDLELKKGDIILGTEAVDDMWWRGKNGSQKGIFPLTFVVELELGDVTCSKLFSEHSHESSLKDIKSQLDRGSMKDDNSRLTEVTMARALMNVTAQLDGELSFQQGELIEVTTILEDGWLYGRCGSKEGLLSAVCIELLGNVYSKSKLGADSKNKINLSTVDDSFHQSQHFCESDNCLRTLTEVDLESRSRVNSSGSFTSENTRSHDVQVTPFGRVMYPFTSQTPSELSLSKNSIVTLIKHVDMDWTEGEVEGKRGIFPTSFIEIIVDCSYACKQDQEIGQSTSTQSSGRDYPPKNNIGLHIETAAASVPINIYENCRESLAVSKTKLTNDDSGFMTTSSGITVVGPNEISGHQKGLALNSFMDEVSANISVSKNDTVEVIRSVDEDWLEISTSDGKIGHVPKNYIKITKPCSKEGHNSSEYSNSSRSPTTFTENCNEPLSSENALIYKAVCDSDRKCTEQCLSVKTGDNKIIKTSASSTTKITVPTIKPRLSPITKPSIRPKPAVSPKPTKVPKPFTVTHPDSLLAKPISESKSKAEQISLSLEKDKASLNSDSGVEISDLTTTTPKSSLVISSLILTNEQERCDRKDILATPFSHSEDNSAKSRASYIKKSTSSAEQKMPNVSFLAQNVMVLEDYSADDVSDGAITDLDVYTTNVSFCRPARTDLTAPINAKHVSSVSDIAEATPAKLTNHPPCPIPRTTHSSSSVSPVLSQVESQRKPMPKRSAKKIQTNHSLDFSAPSQRVSAYIDHQPRRPPPRSASFPKTPKRPPPRPRDFQFFTSDGFSTEETSLELVADLKRKLKENQANIKVGDLLLSICTGKGRQAII